MLQVSPALAFPVDAATQTFGILAKRGAGKSNAAVVMAEEMFTAEIPWVAVDPKGDWWGMRSSADGLGPGLPIVVFGGRHGDVPLEPTAGAVIADLVLDKRLTCVLDVSEFSKADSRRFLLAFGDRLYRHANDEPLHLFLEEAHEYLPQMVRGADAELVGAWQRIVKQGRFKGLGCTLITQRSAALNKDVLTQVETLIVLRTTSPQDRAAVRAWVDFHSQATDLVDSLPTLADGEAWVWSPDFLKTLERVQWRRRRTFDSAATPQVGQTSRQPSTLADVDLGAIKESMADTIERAKNDDPRELRRRIADLEATAKKAELQRARVEDELAQLRARPEPEPADVGWIAGLVDDALADALVGIRSAVTGELEAAVQRIRDGLNARSTDPRARKLLQLVPLLRPVLNVAEDVEVFVGDPLTPDGGWVPADGRLVPLVSVPNEDLDVLRPKPTGPQRKLLTVLAVYGPRTKQQLAIQAGYAMGGGGFSNPLGALRSNGWVTKTKGDPIAITESGIAALGDYDPLPSGQALVDHWMNQLPGPAQKILRPLIDAWPAALTKEELARAAGYAPVGGGFNNPLGRLRTLGLATRGADIRLTDDFADAIR